MALSLFGAHKIDQGILSINGKNVVISNPVEAIKNGIALVPEDRFSDSLVSCFDLSENISLSSLSRFSRFFF